MRIGVVSIFPEIFPGPLGISIVGKGLTEGLWQLETIDLKMFKKKKQIDDTPFGGGAGMIIRADVMEKCLSSLDFEYNTILCMSPKGRPVTQALIKELEQRPNLLFICNRYEGLDQRAIDFYKMEEVCVGSFVMCGGEIPAMAIIEAIIRLKVIGNKDSLQEESFWTSEHQVEHDQFTRPREWKGLSVPNVLVEGNHKLIEQWKKESSSKNSLKRSQIIDQ
jgi:tRNA (guanine37-N1)-methyltransferase